MLARLRRDLGDDHKEQLAEALVVLLDTVTTCSWETGSAPSTPTSWSVTMEMFA
jgi:hypothetical protein